LINLGARDLEQAAMPNRAPLRVLFVTGMHPTARLPRRGVIIRRIAEALGRRGHKIELLDVGGHRGIARYLEAWPKVARAVRQSRPDLIHVHFGYSVLAIPRVPVPLVASFYGDDLNGTSTRTGKTSFKSRVGVLVSNWLAARSRRCIVVSEGMRERFWWARLRQKTVVVRDAVDLRLFVARSRAEARARLGLEHDRLLVLFPHREEDPNKRLSLAVRAVDAIRPSVPDAELWIVNGRAPDEMPWYYAAADVMLVTSVREGGPSSAKEALACGIPVVSVPVGDVGLAKDAPDAVFLCAATPEALAEGLRAALIKAREPRRSRLPLHLTLCAAAQQIEAVYYDALAQV